ncbi:unnamed protein product [Prunus armeniaca]
MHIVSVNRHAPPCSHRFRPPEATTPEPNEPARPRLILQLSPAVSRLQFAGNSRNRASFDRNFTAVVLRPPATNSGNQEPKVWPDFGLKFRPLSAIFRGRSKNKSGSNRCPKPVVGILALNFEVFPAAGIA